MPEMNFETETPREFVPLDDSQTIDGLTLARILCDVPDFDIDLTDLFEEIAE